MTKTKRNKRRINSDQEALHRKLEIEQHRPSLYKPGWTRCTGRL